MNRHLVLRPYGLALIMGLVTILALYDQDWTLALTALSAALGWALADHNKTHA